MKMIEMFEPGDVVYRVADGHDSEVASVSHVSYTAYFAQDKSHEVSQVRVNFFGGHDPENAANFQLWAPKEQQNG